MKNEAVRKKMEAFGIDPEDFNNDMATVVSLYQKALKGDVGAFATIRDTAGERPIIKQETTVVTPKPLVDLTDMFDKKKDKK